VAGLAGQNPGVVLPHSATALFRYIESFHNPLRRHSSLEMHSPDEYEHRYWEDNAAAAAA
jgi:transposase InsO family protein